MLLHDVIRRAGAATPDAPALVSGGVTTTFAALADRVGRAGALVAEMTDPGDRVGIVGDNDAAWVDAYYGVPAVGRILVFLNHRLAPAELCAIAARAGISMLIGAPDHLGRLDVDVPKVGFDAWNDELQRREPATALAADPAGAAWIIYTSGTTAQPKGAVLTHASILAACAVAAAARPVMGDDVYVFPFPLCHVAGYNLVHHHALGRPVVLLPRFEARAFVDAVARHGGTTTSVAATMLSPLLDVAETDAPARTTLRSMRLIGYGAAPMPVATLRRSAALLDVDMAQGYGMTELSGNAVFLGPEQHRRGLAGEDRLLASAGTPGPGVEVRVVDDRGVARGPAAAGEILVRGPQVMAAYWDDPAGSADALVDGWLRTGDIGRWDDEGYLYVVDRKKDVIVSGGENISSLEVEQLLASFPGVREVAVVGVPDPRWGENVCAVVAPQPGVDLDPDALVGAVRAALGGFKVPRHVVMVAELPRNATGKVVKAELRRRLAADPSLLGERR